MAEINQSSPIPTMPAFLDSSGNISENPRHGRHRQYGHVPSGGHDESEGPHRREQREGEVGLAFSASLENVRVLGPLIRSAHIKSWVHWIISARGIKIVAGDAVVQAAVYIPGTMFRSYMFSLLEAGEAAGAVGDNERMVDDNLDPDEDQPAQLEMTLDTATLLECLNIYNTAFISAVPGSANADKSLEQLAAASAGLGRLHASTKLRLVCESASAPSLTLNLTEKGVVTDCRLIAFEPPHALEAALQVAGAWEESAAVSRSQVIAELGAEGAREVGLMYRAIVHAEWLRDALVEMGAAVGGYGQSFGASSGGNGGANDPHHAAEEAGAIAADSAMQAAAHLKSARGGPDGLADGHFELCVSETAGITLRTVGDAGEAEVELPYAAKALDLLEVHSPEPLVWRYPTRSFAAATKCALPLASKISLRANASGFLCMQCMVPVREGVTSFVEYLISPLELH